MKKKTARILSLSFETLRNLYGGEPEEAGKVSPKPIGTEATAITNPYFTCT